MAAGLSSPAAAASTATLMGVDLFGTDRFTAADVEAKFGGDIRAWAAKKNEGLKSKKAAKLADQMMRGLETDVKTAWDLGWVRLSWKDYFAADSHTAYLTVDVVERGDLKERMPFRRPPTHPFGDPGGLCALWNQYSDAGWALVRKGELPVERADCKSFYCQWGAEPPELQAMEEKFVEQAAGRQQELAQVLREDIDPDHRAAAVYLLAYLRNGNELSHFIASALDDPDLEVRSAAMKVFSDLAVYHKDVYLPMDSITAMLDFPTVEDRSNALAVLVGLADDRPQRRYLLEHAAERIVKLLRLGQPANHELAYTFLGVFSGESYGATDYDAWQQWVLKAKQAPPPDAGPGGGPPAISGGGTSKPARPLRDYMSWRKWIFRVKESSAPAPAEPAEPSSDGEQKK